MWRLEPSDCTGWTWSSINIQLAQLLQTVVHGRVLHSAAASVWIGHILQHFFLCWAQVHVPYSGDVADAILQQLRFLCYSQVYVECSGDMVDAILQQHFFLCWPQVYVAYPGDMADAILRQLLFLVLPSGVCGVFWWRGRCQTSLCPDSPVPPSGPASKHHPNPRQRSNPRYACRRQSCPCLHSRAGEWFKATNPVPRPLPWVLIQWSANFGWLVVWTCVYTYCWTPCFYVTTANLKEKTVPQWCWHLLKCLSEILQTLQDGNCCAMSNVSRYYL